MISNIFKTDSKCVYVLFILLSIMPMTFAATFKAPNGKIISYNDVGDGSPLVLIHAFPTDKQLWNPQQEGLKKYFRVITVDLLGFGNSSAVDGKAITMKNYADEIKQLLDYLHIKNVVIGGESMGGYIALALYNKYPEKVAGLVLSDTQSIADSVEAKAKREQTAIDVLKHGTADFINGFMLKALSIHASEETKKFLLQLLNKQHSTAMASALRGMALRDDTSIVLANSVLPILIITGDEDTLISPKQSYHMHTLAKHSKLVVLANAGHLSNLEQPEKWNQAVIDMFYQVPINQ